MKILTWKLINLHQAKRYFDDNKIFYGVHFQRFIKGNVVGNSVQVLGEIGLVEIYFKV